MTELERGAGCVFCAIVAGKLPAVMVLERSDVCAFLDRRPLFKGHILVVPRAHVETVADLEPAAIGPLFGAVRELALGVQRALSAEGTFIALNNVVSQSVPHLHVHVVPRRKGDGLRGFFWPRQGYQSDAEAEEIGRRIAAAL